MVWKAHSAFRNTDFFRNSPRRNESRPMRRKGPPNTPEEGDGSSDKYRKEAIVARKPTNYLCQPKQKTKR